MKRITALLVFIIFSITVFAQSDSWYFSFSMGRSFPLDAYKQTDIGNKSSGYAQNGFNLILDATFPLSDHFGVKGMASINSNPVDRKMLGTMLETRIPTSISIPTLADHRYLSLSTNAWMWNALMAGAVYTFNFNRIHWDFQVLGGMNVTYLPQQKLSYEKPTNNWYYSDINTTNSNISYGVLAGTALRFPITNRFNLKVAIDYFKSGANIKYEQLKVSTQGETIVTEQIGSGTAYIPISSVSGSIGFVYYLN